MSDLQHQIRSLSAAEKFDLLDAVWESLENDPIPLSVEQREELDYRVARYRENPANVTPWQQVRADLYKSR